jgi:uncharacterized protein YndB with AHSA1/START domain
MIQAEASIIINRPVEEVFAFVANQHNAPQWQPTLLGVHRITEGPIGVGTKHIVVRAFMDQHLEMINEYVKFEPNQEITFTGGSDETRFATSYVFERVDGGTKITNVTHMGQNHAFKGDDQQVVRQLETDFMAAFQALKTLLENQQSPINNTIQS